MSHLKKIIVQLFNNAVQMNRFCSDYFDTETIVAPSNMLIRSGGTETICASLRRCRCLWSREL